MGAGEPEVFFKVPLPSLGEGFRVRAELGQQKILSKKKAIAKEVADKTKSHPPFPFT